MGKRLADFPSISFEGKDLHNMGNSKWDKHATYEIGGTIDDPKYARGTDPIPQE